LEEESKKIRIRRKVGNRRRRSSTEIGQRIREEPTTRRGDQTVVGEGTFSIN